MAKRTSKSSKTQTSEPDDVIGCGCCRGPENDRCCCHFHQDITRGLWAHKCSRHDSRSLLPAIEM